jgi:hypothetical protein
MRARLQHISLIAVCIVAFVILASGCVLKIDDAGSATLKPSSSSSVPAPAGLYLDPPVPAPQVNETVIPVMQEPAARVPYVDPAFGTRDVRITDRVADISRGDTSAGLKIEDSRVQSFNADGSRLLLQGTAGSWYLYNATTLLPEGRLPFDGAVEPRWDAVRPDVIYYFDGPRMMRYDIAAQGRKTIHDFSGQFSPHAPANVWTRSGGSPSQDGRYWGLMAQGAMGKTFAFIIYDLQADQIVARKDITPTMGVTGVTISPLGDYFLANFEPRPDGSPGTDADPAGLMVYDTNLKNGRCLASNVSYYDVALDAQGREALVYHNKDALSMCDLATGQSTDFLLIKASPYFSGRATCLPGWLLVSVNDRIFAVELKQGAGTVELACTYSQAEPLATVDRNFTRVLFTSNWGQSDATAADTYMIVLRQGWTDRLA